MNIFIDDSNFFIQAHRMTYPLDVAIGFWKKVRFLAHNGILISIDKVKNELYNKNDALEKWCKENLPGSFFMDSTTAMKEYAQVTSWAISQRDHYLPKAINEFLSAEEADAFLIACALQDIGNRYIVTYEVSAPKKTSKIKIPDCCNALNVSYLTPIEMFRALNETF